MLPRVVAVVIVLTMPAAYYLKHAMPDLEFEWAGNIALSIGEFVVVLPCIYGLSWLIPPIIGIKKQGVTRQEGEHVVWRRRADIRRITIDTIQEFSSLNKDDKDRHRLSAVAQTVRNKQFTVFMMANQLPLLQMGRNAPKVSGEDRAYCDEDSPKAKERVMRRIMRIRVPEEVHVTIELI